MSKGARNRAIRLAERDAPPKPDAQKRPTGRGGDPQGYWDRQFKRKRELPGRSGAEKRRARRRRGGRAGRSRRGYLVSR